MIFNMRRVGPEYPVFSHNQEACRHSAIKMGGQNQQQHRRGPGAIGDRITHSLRRRTRVPDRSPINPFIKYFLFLWNFAWLLVGLLGLVLGAYVIEMKGKTVSGFIDFILDPACVSCLVGCVIVVIAFFGCYGALREFEIFLKLYHWGLSILLLLEIVLVVFVFVFYFVENSAQTLGLYPEEYLEDAVIRYRNDADMQEFIDNIQKELSCCGVSNDDQGYLIWDKNPYFNCTRGPNGNKSPEACSVPFSCCRISEGENINYQCGADMLDAQTTDHSAIYTIGCLKGLQKFISDNIWVVGGGIFAVFVPQIFCIFCAKALVAQIQEQKMKWRF